MPTGTQKWCEGSSQGDQKTIFSSSSFYLRAHPPGSDDKREFRTVLSGKQSGAQGVTQNTWFIVFQC